MARLSSAYPQAQSIPLDRDELVRGLAPEEGTVIDVVYQNAFPGVQP